ncbi:MAG: ABC transporter permease [Lentisphaerae bacterium]|nr:MAG: ABC transporter permease [Lentisphaerota bacterium]
MDQESTGKMSFGEFYRRFGSLITLLILVIISAVASEHFLKPQNLLNILRQVSYTGVIALGMTFVITAGGIDLSVGSMVALVGGLALMGQDKLIDGWIGVCGGVAIAVGLGLLAGALNGILITRGRLAPFIVTLGTMSIFRSLILYFSGAGEVRCANEAFGTLGSSSLVGIPIPVFVFLILGAIAHVLLEYTRFGRYVCAVGYNEQVAHYSGIRVGLVKFCTYVLCGFTAGVSAVILSSRMNSISSTTAGVAFELDAIAAVVIGGTSMNGGYGTVAGTIVGAIILGVINNMLNMLGVSPYLHGCVKGFVIILAVLLQYRRNRS